MHPLLALWAPSTASCVRWCRAQGLAQPQAHGPLGRRATWADQPLGRRAPWALQLLVFPGAWLQAYLCLFWPVGGALEAAVHALSFLVVRTCSDEMCGCPASHHGGQPLSGIKLSPSNPRPGLRCAVLRCHPHHTPLQACSLHSAIVQLVCGCLAPLLLHTCKNARRAVAFAEQHSISRANRRRRRMVWVRRYVCTTAQLPAALLATAPLLAGVVLLVPDVLWGGS